MSGLPIEIRIQTLFQTELYGMLTPMFTGMKPGFNRTGHFVFRGQAPRHTVR